MIILKLLLMIYNFIVDKSKHIALRISIPLISVIALLIINDLSGFTRSYFLNQKLDKLKEIQTLEPNVMQADANYKHTYEIVKKEILFDHSYLNDLYQDVFSIKNIPKVDNIKSNLIFSDHIWLNLSSMFLSYLVCIIIIGVGIVVSFKSKGRQVLGTIISVIFMVIVVLGLGRLFKELNDWIFPIFNENAWINIIINGIVQFFIGFIIIFLIRRLRTTNPIHS